ncbi:RrF2 family transcriptional regulator [Orrella marina]|uniref:Rrf2 family transcriptional regulator n=1 Tax=Orrella marina TaxID=2163011 RepID=A0A2R4XKP4_9BURK|nr:Rrf2 family transcriptional regulator [Orrella marina]AWB34367.1 Rrf2 family transcriptional regulator [Orrella marina]
MRLTTLTDYAMRLLIYVGQNPDRLCTIAEIAQAHGISEPHLMKVTHRLAQTGWLETVRGKNGGMRLSRPPAQIRLGDVIRDTENDLSLVECFAGHSNCVLLGSCRLAGVLSGALDQFMNYLDQFTLADILPFDALTMPPTTPGSGDIPPDSAGRGRDGFVRIVPHH